MFKNLKQHSSCSDYILDLLEYVETNLLRVDHSKRARIDDIAKKFEMFDVDCRKMHAYCTLRTREARDGPGLAEIIEFPEESDRPSESTPPERGPSQSQSPLSPWQSHDGSVLDREQARNEWSQVARRSTGLGISHDATEKPQDDSKTKAPLHSDSPPKDSRRQPHPEDPQVYSADHANITPTSGTQKLPNEEKVEPSSHQNETKRYDPIHNPERQSIAEQEPHNANLHSPALPPGHVNSNNHVATGLTRGMLTEDQPGHQPASLRAKSYRKRARQKILKVLDFFLPS